MKCQDKQAREDTHVLYLTLSDRKEQVVQIPKPHNLESFSPLITQYTLPFFLPLLYDQVKKKKGNNSDFLKL